MVLPQRIITRLDNLANAILNKISSKIEAHNSSDNPHPNKFVKIADNYKHAHGHISQDGTLTESSNTASGVLVTEKNTNKIKKMAKLPADVITHQNLDGKVDKNQTTANSGKFMKVGSNGYIEPQSVTIPTVNVVQTKQNSSSVEEIGSINGIKLYCNQNTTYGVVGTTSGLMTPQMATKLSNIKEGANNTVYNQILKQGSVVGTITTDGGNPVNIYAPEQKTYTAADGIKLEGTSFKHSNSTASKSNAALYKITYDGQGHIKTGEEVEIDSTPTLNSNKLVNSFGIKKTIDDLQEILTNKIRTKQDAIPQVRTVTLTDVQTQTPDIKLYKWGNFVICNFYIDSFTFEKNGNSVQSKVAKIANAIPDPYKPSSLYTKNTDILAILNDDATVDQYTCRVFIEIENSSEKFQIKGRSRYKETPIHIRGQLMWFTD